MKTTASDRLVRFVRRHKTNRLVVRRTSLGAIMFFFLAAVGSPADPPAPKVPRTWPQAYSVERDEASGILTLRTPYYTVEQDLKKGGADHADRTDAREGREPARRIPWRPASGTKAEPCLRT